MDNNGQYMYYQNFYNMFDGYNPIIDERVKKLRHMGLVIGCGMLGFTVMQYVIAFLLQAFNLYDLYVTDTVFQMGISAIAPVLYVFLPFLVSFMFYPKQDKHSVDIFNLPKSKELFVFAVFAGLMICSLGDRVASFFSAIVSMFGADFEGPETENPTTLLGCILQVVAYAVIPPLVEEFAMRGVVMQPLRKYGDKFAIVVSSILFAALHGNMQQIPFAFIAGLVLGYFAIATESIWTSIVIHCLNNLSSVILSIYYTRHPDESMLFYFAIEGVIFAVGVLAFILFVKTDKATLKKDSSEIGSSLKYSTVLCTPTIAFSFLIAISTSLDYTSFNSGLGSLLVFGLIVLATVLLIKGSLKARADQRIRKSPMYIVSIVLTSVTAFFLMVGTIVVSLE